MWVVLKGALSVIITSTYQKFCGGEPRQLLSVFWLKSTFNRSLLFNNDVDL